MICTARISGIPTTKYQCLVLCRNAYIPAQLPALPPKILQTNSVLSEIRQAFLFARDLSIPISANPRIFITTTYTRKTPIFSLLAKSAEIDAKTHRVRKRFISKIGTKPTGTTYAHHLRISS